MRRRGKKQNKTERKPRSKKTWLVRPKPQLWRPKCETKYRYEHWQTRFQRHPRKTPPKKPKIDKTRIKIKNEF